MPRKPVFVEQPDRAELPPAPVESPWTNEQLKAVSHLGPGIIGPEMFAASQAYMKSSANGILGPATRGD